MNTHSAPASTPGRDSSRAPDLDVIASLPQAAALLQPARLQLVAALSEPDSASGLSRRLGIPRQRINYHLRELEKQQLVEFVEERRKGNCVERVVRATARAYLISPEALGALGIPPEEASDRFSAAYLMAAAARAIRDTAIVRRRALAARKRLATLTIETDVRFASAQARNAFTEELTTAIAKLVARHHHERAEGGRTFRFLTCGYPAVLDAGASPAQSDDHTMPTAGNARMARPTKRRRA